MTCIVCNGRIGSRNKSGRCKKCQLDFINSDPDVETKRRNSYRNRMATDPLFNARMREHARQMGLRAGQDPEVRARRVAFGKHIHATVLSRPDIREKTLRAVREKSGPTQHERKLAWCPPEYRAEYLRLLNNGKLRKAEAQRVILDQVAADKRRELAKLSPFERQQRALERGAQLIANDAGPRFGEVLKAVGE